jgi:hypothetical protein
MDVSGEHLHVEHVRVDSYIIFKGRTPFRLECIWPLDRVPESKARSACTRVMSTLRLTTAPITG